MPRRRTVAVFDMRIHNPQSYEEIQNLDITRLYNDLVEEFTYIRNPNPGSRGHPHVHFGHLLSGYDAGYYAYIWALVFGADVFETKFAQDPRNRNVWERYRRTILEPGGSRDEMNLVEEFLGRSLSPEPLLRRLGLNKKRV